MKQKDILFILILSFVVTVSWISFSIYHIVVTSTIGQTLGVQIQPIPGTFDTETIGRLKKRQVVPPDFEFSLTGAQNNPEASDSGIQVEQVNLDVDTAETPSPTPEIPAATDAIQNTGETQ